MQRQYDSFIRQAQDNGLDAALDWTERRAGIEIEKVRRAAESGSRKKLRSAIRGATGNLAFRITCLRKAKYRASQASSYARRARMLDLSAPFNGMVPWEAK